MTIPIGHLTTVGTLLTLPTMRALVGHFEEDVLTHTEAQRSVPISLSLQSMSVSAISWPSLSLDMAEVMQERFLETVYPSHPIFDRHDFFERIMRCSESHFAPSVDSALCMVAFALGQIAGSTPQAPDIAEDNWAPGATLFRPAVHFLLDYGMNSFGSSEMLPPALYLCAVYFSYLARPLQAWKLVHMASVHLQQVRQMLLRSVNCRHPSRDDREILTSPEMISYPAQTTLASRHLYVLRGRCSYSKGRFRSCMASVSFEHHLKTGQRSARGASSTPKWH